MIDDDHTLTSPLSAVAQRSPALLGLTIVWHPDMQRVGEQYIVADPREEAQLARFLPLFARPGQPGTPLGYGGISRDPVRISVGSDGSVLVAPPASRMVVELNGAEITAPVRLARVQVDAGAILGLGRAVLVCLHRVTQLPRANPVPGMLGVGSAAIRIRDLVRQAASTDAPVLLLGETGTGKEIAARAIHGLSVRAARPMVSVNMAALSESLAAADLFGATKGAYTGAQAAREGLFAEAEGGTLFLDEIGNTPAAIQPMLLRVLEAGDYRPLGASRDQRADVRLVAATDQDLYGPSFNQPLLRRLESFVIELPPLRARREDIGVLLVALLAGQALPGEELALPPAFVSELANYDWPGNIRQLAHLVNRAVLALRHGETPSLAALVPARNAPAAESAAPDVGAAGPARRKLAELSPEEILTAMERNGWEIQGAAKLLGISRPSLYKLLESHPQIRRPERIGGDELLAAFDASGGDVGRCASILRTPGEALRRHLRALGVLA